MEHGTAEEERTLHAVARMNLRIKVAYSKKYKVSQAARTQLFSIPRTRRIQYKVETNERWLDLVDARLIISNGKTIGYTNPSVESQTTTYLRWYPG